MGLFIDTLIMKVKRKDDHVNVFAPSEFLWLCAALI